MRISIAGRRAVVALLMMAVAGCGKKPDVTGRWEGPLDLSGIVGGKPIDTTFHIVLHIHDSSGHLAATFVSREESAEEVTADSVEFQNGTLIVKIGKRHEVYEGKINGDGNEIRGRLKQAPYDMPLNLKKSIGF